jgi:hypothetical protein
MALEQVFHTVAHFFALSAQQQKPLTPDVLQ